MKRLPLAPLLVIAAVVAVTAWFLLNFERVPAREPVGMKGEARLRPYLAAQRFAGRMGLPAREIRTLQALDAVPRDAVLLLPSGRQFFEAERLQRIEAWVNGGGHLLVEAEMLHVDDPLLSRLGIGRTVSPGPPMIDVTSPEDGRTLKAAIPGPTLTPPPGTPLLLSAGLTAQPRLLSFQRGKGRVTVAANLGFARNVTIGANDHAELFWRLVRLEPAGELHVFFNPERLSLWNFLAEHAAAALAATAALLALWLWWVIPRFGPPVPDLPPERRRLLDHLRASGRYYWSHGLRARLVSAARQAVLRRVSRAQPDFGSAPAAEQAARLGALAGIPAAEAARLLTSQGEERGVEFVHLMHYAQRVHAALQQGVTRKTP